MDEIKAKWTRPGWLVRDLAQPCDRCGALGPCCDTSAMRALTASSLARLVDRQREEIETLRALHKERRAKWLGWGRERPGGRAGN